MYCLYICFYVAVLLVECSGLDPSIKWTNEQPLLSTRQRLYDDIRYAKNHTYQYLFDQELHVVGR